MRQSHVIAALTSLAFVLAAGAFIHVYRLNRLLVVNQSKQAIEGLSITVGGQTIQFADIRAGGEVSAPFVIRSDDQFVVRGRLHDGTAISTDCGYVTHSRSRQRASFAIQADGRVEFEQSHSIGW